MIFALFRAFLQLKRSSSKFHENRKKSIFGQNIDFGSFGRCDVRCIYIVKNRHLGSFWAIFKPEIISTWFRTIFENFEFLKFFPAKISKNPHFLPSNFRSWPIFGQKILKKYFLKSYLFPKKNACDRSEKLWMCSEKWGKLPFFTFLTWTGSCWFPLSPTEFHFVLHIFKKFRSSAFSQYIHCWGYSSPKKSYLTLKFWHTTVSHLCIEFTYVLSY